jgi:DNA-binding MarR family transcriptional regulator
MLGVKLRSVTEMESDRIDQLVGQWRAERPDLDLETIGLAARLLRAAQLLDRGIADTAAEHGLSRSEGDVLLTLRRAGKPHRLSPSALGESLLVSSGTMTNRLDRLEERGLIAREPNPNDRRGLDVLLTAEGLKLVDRAVGEHVENEERMLSGLTRSGLRQLDGLLRKLVWGLEAAG